MNSRGLRILILGAYSAIAQETARCFAKDGAQLFLAGKSAEKLAILAADLKSRGAEKVDWLSADFVDFQKHQELMDRAKQSIGNLDVVVIAYGVLPDQYQCERSACLTLQVLETNLSSILSFLTLAANEFEIQKKGTLAVIASVAGDRGRKSNYVYGTTKGALAIFLQGLRARLFSAGVHVLTIKPGFVDTPMTASMKKNALFSCPIDVGRGIYRAILTKKDEVYLPSYWALIMSVVRAIPEGLFKRIKL